MVPPPPASELGGRLHPSTIALWPLSQLGPLVFLFVAGRLEPAIGAVVLAGLLAMSLVRWLRFTWHVDRGALVVEQGLLERRRRVIPRERVQSVDLVRKLRHRALGVVEVRVEAVGGGETEGRLAAVTPAEARRLRAALLDDGPPAADGTTADAGEPLAHVAPRQLVVAGITGGRVGVMAALLGFGQELLGDRLDELVARAPAVLGLRGIVAVAFAVLLLAFLLSIAATIVTYWDFTLDVEGPRLRVRRGLLQQRVDTIPLRRVQSVRVEENLLRRGLGLAAVKVDVAGRAGGEEGQQTGLLLPLGTRAEAFELVARVLEAAGHGADPAPTLTPMPQGARDRRLVRAVLPVLALTAGLVWWRGPAGAAVLLVLVPAVAAALDAYRSLGSGRVDGTVVARSGVLVRRTAFVPTGRVQSLAVTTSPVQRRRRLATVHLQIARSPGVWQGPRLVDIGEDDAERWLSELADRLSARPATPVPAPSDAGTV